MQKRKGWQTGNVLNMVDVWKERAVSVIGRSIDSGHFLPEEAPDDVLIELVNFFKNIDNRK